MHNGYDALLGLCCILFVAPDAQVHALQGTEEMFKDGLWELDIPDNNVSHSCVV